MWHLSKRLRAETPKWLKTSGLAVAGLAALYAGMPRSLSRGPGIDSERGTGLAAVRSTQFYERDLLSRMLVRNASPTEGTVRGGFVGEPASDKMEMADTAAPAPPAPSPESTPDDTGRKMVRTDSIDLTVEHPADAAEKVTQLAMRLGGFLVTSEVSGDPDLPSAALTIRVPAARFEEARAEIRKLSLRVESERIEAEDVTRQYVDQQAHLRNLQAEEQQYLLILKRATTVKDTLEVSDKLSEVRGNIEQQQAEFDALSKQVETVAITISFRAEADTQVLGLHWRPLYRLKVAARNGLDSFGEYLGNMASLIFSLPAILLWLATILAGAALGWRILRWAGRVFFGRRTAAASTLGSSAPAQEH